MIRVQSGMCEAGGGLPLHSVGNVKCNAYACVMGLVLSSCSYFLQSRTFPQVCSTSFCVKLNGFSTISLCATIMEQLRSTSTSTTQPSLIFPKSKRHMTEKLSQHPSSILSPRIASHKLQHRIAVVPDYSSIHASTPRHTQAVRSASIAFGISRTHRRLLHVASSSGS